jgi:hypothetical protein
MYGWSILHSLPVGIITTTRPAQAPSCGKLASYARTAGFTCVETLPIDKFRVYRLQRGRHLT